MTSEAGFPSTLALKDTYLLQLLEKSHNGSCIVFSLCQTKQEILQSFGFVPADLSLSPSASYRVKEITLLTVWQAARREVRMTGCAFMKKG